VTAANVFTFVIVVVLVVALLELADRISK